MLIALALIAWNIVEISNANENIRTISRIMQMQAETNDALVNAVFGE